MVSKGERTRSNRQALFSKSARGNRYISVTSAIQIIHWSVLFRCIKVPDAVKLINIMDTNLYVDALKTTFLPYVKSIHDLHFCYDNPLLWLAFLVVFLILLIGMSWDTGKAFFFCLIITLILLGTTWFEGYIAGIFMKPVESFDPFIIRVLSLMMIAGAILYFLLVDDS